MNAAAHPDTVWFSVKGQVVIPRWLRKQYEIEKGTRAVLTPTPEGILLQPITARHIRSLRGSLKGRGLLKALMADRQREREL